MNSRVSHHFIIFIIFWQSVLKFRKLRSAFVVKHTCTLSYKGKWVDDAPQTTSFSCGQKDQCPTTNIQCTYLLIWFAARVRILYYILLFNDSETYYYKTVFQRLRQLRKKPSLFEKRWSLYVNVVFRASKEFKVELEIYLIRTISNLTMELV